MFLVFGRYLEVNLAKTWTAYLATTWRVYLAALGHRRMGRFERQEHELQVQPCPSLQPGHRIMGHLERQEHELHMQFNLATCSTAPELLPGHRRVGRLG